jgi:hypothetical protein
MNQTTLRGLQFHVLFILVAAAGVHAQDSSPKLGSEVAIPAFDALSRDQQNEVIEFLKSLQVLPPNSRSLVGDENGNPKRWPPAGGATEQD